MLRYILQSMIWRPNLIKNPTRFAKLDTCYLITVHICIMHAEIYNAKYDMTTKNLIKTHPGLPNWTLAIWSQWWRPPPTTRPTWTMAQMQPQATRVWSCRWYALPRWGYVTQIHIFFLVMPLICPTEMRVYNTNSSFVWGSEMRYIGKHFNV